MELYFWIASLGEILFKGHQATLLGSRTPICASPGVTAEKKKRYRISSGVKSEASLCFFVCLWFGVFFWYSSITIRTETLVHFLHLSKKLFRQTWNMA